ncbi:hypothetical protein HJFPF1_13073 [Paramyrothecium foliicola]|nr:hypothetical protein HJFPF1_13073 [Paramyrothecium foliicola]
MPSAVWQQIRQGAMCIKIVATGGVMSTADNPGHRQFSDDELEALIGKQHSKAAGVHTIEHGSYLDGEAAALMKKQDTTLVATWHIVETRLRRLDKMPPETAVKMVAIADKHPLTKRIAVRCGVKIALGTDFVSSDSSSEISHGRNGSESVRAVKAGLSPRDAIEAASS